MSASASHGTQSARALSASRDLVFAALGETCDLAASYARSAAEAAWRGEEPTLDAHLRQLRACTIEAIKLRNDLTAPGAEVRAA